jgi:hypothetical protein
MRQMGYVGNVTSYYPIYPSTSHLSHLSHKKMPINQKQKLHIMQKILRKSNRYYEEAVRKEETQEAEEYLNKNSEL